MFEKRDRGQQVGALMLAFLAGAFTGAALALIYAPMSGEKLRKKVRGRYKDVRDSIEDGLDDVVDKFDDVRDKVKDAGDSISSTFKKFRK